MSKIARSSAIITVFTVLGLGLSFLSNVVVAASFGAGTDMDVFLAATAIPVFITNILSSSLTFTFIPVFAQYRAEHPGETWTVVSSFINISAAAAAAICLAGMLLSGRLMALTAPGFDAAKLARSASLLAWLFPVIAFTLVNELLASVYYSNHRFVIPSLNKVISPLITMGYVLAFHDTLSTKSIALAMLTAGFLQTAILAAGFLRTKDFNYSLTMDWRHPGVIRVFRLMAPLVAGMLVYKAVPVSDAFFLSRLPSGSISHIGYAYKTLGAILPLIVSGISVSIFPVMSAYAAQKNWDAFIGVTAKGVRMLLFLSLPFVAILGIYGRPVIQLIFERGTFHPRDTSAVYFAFAAYLLSLPAATAGSTISQGFYALQRTTMISMIGVAMMLLYIGLCFALIGPLGYLAIPVAFALYHSSAVWVTSFFLKRELRLPWPGTPGFTAKSLSAAAAAAALLYFPMSLASASAPVSAALCAAGFAVYFLIGKFLFTLEEADLVWRLLTGKLQPKAAR